MPLNVKPIDASSTKWTDNAGRAATEYATNAAAGAETWARNTAGSADTFGQAISAAGIKNRFRSGVVKAGAAKYARKINDVGKDRFGPGVAAAKDDYKAGAEPYFSTLASLSLSARKPKGDPANYKRVEEVGKALNSKRLAMLGSS
jgi:hypothetical protein